MGGGRCALLVDSVAVACGLRDYQKANCFRRRVADLMAGSRQNVNPLSSGNQCLFPIDFHEDLAVQDVKELLCVCMIMAYLGRSRRHEFLNHAQVLIADEVPTVTVDSPTVVLGIVAAH